MMHVRSTSAWTLLLLVACSGERIEPNTRPVNVSFTSGTGGAPAAIAAMQSAGTPATQTAAGTAGNSSMTGAVAGTASSGGGAMPPIKPATPEPSGPPGISVDPQTGGFVFRTPPVDLKPSEEAYMCYAATVQEDIVVDGFSQAAQKFVHHAQFVKTLLPESDGVFPCPEQFKLTWLPIFLSGTGASELQFDEGVGHSLAAGTQLMLQMHLFNTSDQPAKKIVEIKMHKSRSPNPTPVTPWAVGSGEIKVPPRQAGSAQNICTQMGPVEVLAVFPHMHQLGKKMTVEVGKSADSMRMLYTRDPFNFDDQHMEKMRFKLEAGDLLRVTCDFATNPGDTEVVWGESSNDEMCQFVGFALGDAPEQADCPKLWDKILGI